MLQRFLPQESDLEPAMLAAGSLRGLPVTVEPAQSRLIKEFRKPLRKGKKSRTCFKEYQENKDQKNMLVWILFQNALAP